MTKGELQKSLIISRHNIDNKEEKNREIFKNIFPILNEYEDYLCYVSKADEVDTRAIIAYLLINGKSVYAPRCIGKFHMKFYKINCLDDLEEGKFGILQPKIKCKEKLFGGEAMEICIVPGLSFTLDGDRIGYGKGYYDRFLHESSVKSIGLCYNKQISISLPTDKHDERVDIIITEKIIQEVSNVR